MHSSGSGCYSFSPLHLEHSVSSEAEQGPPDVLTLAPPPSSPSCLANLFWKIFSCTEMKPLHPPHGPKSKASLASDPMEGLPQRTEH